MLKKAPTSTKPMIGGKKADKPKNTFNYNDPLQPSAAYGLPSNTSTSLIGRNDIGTRNYQTNIFNKKESSSRNIEEEELEDENSVK